MSEEEQGEKAVRLFGESGGPELGIKTFNFGDLIMEGADGPMVADAGDVVIFITNGDQVMAMALEPEEALKVAEQVMTAALLGQDIINRENGVS